MTHNFLVFTKRVLPISNTFVASQTQFLKHFNPVFTGFSKDLSGIDLVDNHSICVLKEHSRSPKFDKFLLEGFGRMPVPWRRALARFQPKFIHAHFGKGGFYSAAIADALNLPLIVTFHGSDITQKDRFSYGQKHRQRVFERAEKIIASSDFIKRKLIERGCPESKVIRHYIGVDNRYFSPFGQKDEQPTILFAGRLIKQKGCEYLLDAMAKINTVLPEAQLLIAGDGVERERLKAKAKSLNNIHFLGAQNHEQMRNLMNRAWVMCAPSIVLERGNEEGLGMVFLEAQAMGTPVVSFRTGGVVEAVAENQSGILVEEKATDELADSLLNLLTNESLRQEFGELGIKRVDREFNLQKQSLAFESIYASLL